MTQPLQRSRSDSSLRPKAPEMNAISLPAPSLPIMWDEAHHSFFAAQKTAHTQILLSRGLPFSKPSRFRVKPCVHERKASTSSGSSILSGGCTKTKFGECRFAHSWEELFFFREKAGTSPSLKAISVPRENPAAGRYRSHFKRTRPGRERPQRPSQMGGRQATSAGPLE